MSRYARMDHADWIRRDQKLTCSPLGAKAAYILGCTFGGIYNTRMNHEKTNWADTRSVKATVSWSTMATWDFNELTTLVVLAYALCVRVQIGAVAPHRLQFMFSPRTREGGMSTRHPDLDQAVADFKSWFDDFAMKIATGTHKESEAAE